MVPFWNSFWENIYFSKFPPILKKWDNIFGKNVANFFLQKMVKYFERFLQILKMGPFWKILQFFGKFPPIFEKMGQYFWKMVNIFFPTQKENFGKDFLKYLKNGPFLANFTIFWKTSYFLENFPQFLKKCGNLFEKIRPKFPTTGPIFVPKKW